MTGSRYLRYSAGVRALFILDPLEKLGLAGDTSYGLMLEAAARNWEIWTCQLEHLGLVDDDAIVDAVPTKVVDAAQPAQAFSIGERASRRLADFDIVMMRKDPPVDINYLHATWILDHARGKTLLVNDPRGLRELNEHLAVLNFPHLTPPTIVTRSPERLRAFQAEQGGAIVVKPIDGYGGLGVVIGPRASAEELAEARSLIDEQPARWIAQETVALSTHPTFENGWFNPRHVDLRVFVYYGASPVVVPAALTRVAPRGSMVVNSSRGGGAKDTWLLQ
jgi:glutathione synthetase